MNECSVCYYFKQVFIKNHQNFNPENSKLRWKWMPQMLDE